MVVRGHLDGLREVCPEDGSDRGSIPLESSVINVIEPPESATLEFQSMLIPLQLTNSVELSLS
jgi:hypothetical protein